MADINRNNEALLTQERLKELLHYDPDTGIFTWRNTARRIRAGTVAGKTVTRGYIQIGINSKSYFAHRLAHLYMTGSWPTELIDHEDRCTSNNRWKNLRPATHAENMLNQKRGDVAPVTVPLLSDVRERRAKDLQTEKRKQLKALVAPLMRKQVTWVSRGPKNPYPGVHMLGPSRFKATIKVEGKLVHLGYFETPEAANEAFEAARVAREEAA